MAAIIDPRIEQTIAHFNRMFLGGIPPMITDASAFLSFICVLSGVEALAGYRFGAEEPKSGKRFNRFVLTYFPAEYHAYTQPDPARYPEGRLWFFRCRIVHGFSPAGFALTHSQSENHGRIEGASNNPVLNAEDFYSALATAAQAFFEELRGDGTLQARMVARLEDKRHGGTIGVNQLQIAPPSGGATTRP